MFKRWRLKRKIKKAAYQLVEEAMEAYMDLSVYDGPISTRVLWRDAGHYGFGATRRYYDDLQETTITISTKTLYKRIAPPPRPSRTSENPAPDVLPPKNKEHDKDIRNEGGK